MGGVSSWTERLSHITSVVGLPLKINAQLILGDGGLAIEEGQQRVALVGP